MGKGGGGPGAANSKLRMKNEELGSRRVGAPAYKGAGEGEFYVERKNGSSRIRVGGGHSFSSMQVRILRRRYSSSRRP